MVFVAAWALLGWRAGWLSAGISETEVIQTYAAKYLSDREQSGTSEGAAKTDCVAYPATEDPGIWLIVSCGPTPYDASRHYEYYINRMGRLVHSGGPKTWASGQAGST